MHAKLPKLQCVDPCGKYGHLLTFSERVPDELKGTVGEDWPGSFVVKVLYSHKKESWSVVWEAPWHAGNDISRVHGLPSFEVGKRVAQQLVRSYLEGYYGSERFYERRCNE